MSSDLPATNRFWEHKSLAEMSEEEWESLCDGCGRCCTVLLEDEDREEEGFAETSLHCWLFDPVDRRCTRYAERKSLVPNCIQVTAENAASLRWMPKSCAYRRLAEGDGLADWHPLISGRRESVVEAGIAVGPDLKDERKVKAKHLWKYVTGKRD